MFFDYKLLMKDFIQNAISSQHIFIDSKKLIQKKRTIFENIFILNKNRILFDEKKFVVTTAFE